MDHLKFRSWNKYGMYYSTFRSLTEMEDFRVSVKWPEGTIIMRWTGLKDKNEKDIYEGDILEFSDKWEWYKGSYGIRMRFAEPERLKELQNEYDSEPMEQRVIEIPDCYQWIMSNEIQTYWQVIGNIHQNPELLNQ